MGTSQTPWFGSEVWLFLGTVAMSRWFIYNPSLGLFFSKLGEFGVCS